MDPVGRIKQEIKDLDDKLEAWISKVQDYGHSFMTVTGIGVAGIGNTDLYKDRKTTHHILASYVAIGFLAFFSLRFFIPWTLARKILVSVGVWAIFSTLITTMFHVVKPDWWGWMLAGSFLLTAVTVGEKLYGHWLESERLKFLLETAEGAIEIGLQEADPLLATH